MVPSVLMWIYSWGESIAWAIKFGVIVIGALLFILGNKQENE